MRTSLRLAARVQIFPDPGQEDALWHLSNRCRLLYNFALHERNETWLKGRAIRFADQSRALPRINEKYPEYQWVYSKVLQAVLRNLDADFRSFLPLGGTVAPMRTRQDSRVASTSSPWSSTRAASG